jgi:hypothetical protein
VREKGGRKERREKIKGGAAEIGREREDEGKCY